MHHQKKYLNGLTVILQKLVSQQIVVTDKTGYYNLKKLQVPAVMLVNLLSTRTAVLCPDVLKKPNTHLYVNAFS